MNTSASNPPERNSDKASFIIAVIALCFAALAAAWSFIGGACCGWAGWGWSFIGLILSIVSLVMKRSTLGWWALGLSIFSIIWVFVSLEIMASQAKTMMKPIHAGN